MAALLFVFLMPKYHISGVSTTSIPNDIDTVADWAKDAVVKLWACGLLAGDNKGNFNPGNNAKRSEAAALCYRTDETVERWFVETGVKPDPGKQEEPPVTGGNTSGGGGGNGNNGSNTTYYQVDFHTSAAATGATMPA